MKTTLLILSALVLLSCKSDPSAPSSALFAQQPVEISDPELEPSPQPETFTFSKIDGKTFSMADGSLQFSALEIIDSQCGRYLVESMTEADGVLTIVTKRHYPAGPAFYTASACKVPIPVVTSAHRPINGSCMKGTATRIQEPGAITYTIESVNGALAIKRLNYTHEIRRECDPPYYGQTFNAAMAESTFFESL